MRKSSWHRYDAQNEPDEVYPVSLRIPDKRFLESLQDPNPMDLVMPRGDLIKLKSPLEMAMNSIAIHA